jgi:hypothetical protein
MRTRIGVIVRQPDLLRRKICLDNWSRLTLADLVLVDVYAQYQWNIGIKVREEVSASWIMGQTENRDLES